MAKKVVKKDGSVIVSELIIESGSCQDVAKKLPISNFKIKKNPYLTVNFSHYEKDFIGSVLDVYVQSGLIKANIQFWHSEVWFNRKLIRTDSFFDSHINCIPAIGVRVFERDAFGRILSWRLEQVSLNFYPNVNSDIPTVGNQINEIIIQK